MHIHKKNKLEDYLDNLREIPRVSLFHIGAIIINEEDRQIILKTIESKEIPVFDTDNNYPDIILKDLIELLENGKGAILNIIKENLPGKILNQLHNLSCGRGLIDVQLDGEEQRKILNPVPDEGFVVLLMNNDYYENSILGDTVVSFCNLTRQI